MAYLCQLSENMPARGNTLAAQETLRDFLDLSTRCAFEKDREPVTHTYLPWNWITDLDSVTQLQPTIRPQYHYRFVDEITLDPFLKSKIV